MGKTKQKDTGLYYDNAFIAQTWFRLSDEGT